MWSERIDSDNRCDFRPNEGGRVSDENSLNSATVAPEHIGVTHATNDQ